MTTPICRLLPTESADGPSNMAADEVMLRAAERGIASLRFYTWNEPTLSLGYFQAAAARQADPLLADAAWVRRPSGGGAILHQHELTYCLALPAGTPWQARESWLCRFHRTIANVLFSFGVSVRAAACGEEKKLDEFLCFLHHTSGDLLIGSSKVVGSAQRKLRGAIVQHGSILLKQSPLTPALPGIEELSGKRVAEQGLETQIAMEFSRMTGWRIEAAAWDEGERIQIDSIAVEKYVSDAWQLKR